MFITTVLLRQSQRSENREVRKMDAVEYLKERERMCESFGTSCVGCPIHSDSKKAGHYCKTFIRTCPEQAVAIVEQWSKEHPVITNLMKFEEVFGKCDPEVTAPISWWSKEYKEPKGE